MFGTIFTATAGSASMMTTMLPMLAIIAVFYFIMIRPENKRKKEQTNMRDSLTLGDEIITIGGLMGKVVQVTEETVTFETGEDRVRIQVTKNAIGTNVRADKAKAQQQQQQASQKQGGLFGRKKKDNSDDSSN